MMLILGPTEEFVVGILICSKIKKKIPSNLETSHFLYLFDTDWMFTYLFLSFFFTRSENKLKDELSY